MAEKKSEKKTERRIKLAGLRGKQDAGKWHLVDAKGKVLGRMATQIARLLMGKNKTTFLPYWESGDHVVVINALDVRVTGNKREEKLYDHYSGYPGGLKQYNFEKLMDKDPREIVIRAVKGMIPKNRLGDRMMTRLLVYPGPDHKHIAQNPTPVNI